LRAFPMNQASNLNPHPRQRGRLDAYDVDAITAKVKKEFAAKEKARLTAKPPTKGVAKAQPKPAKKAKAA